MDLFKGADSLTPFHPATRAGGLEHLRRFVPRAGGAYAAKRNYDLGADGHVHVSQLSAYLRHRLISEEEVLAAVLERYAPSTAEKFIQEVFWRSYWKGWLEQRPGIWQEYQRTLRADQTALFEDQDLADRYWDAVAGQTGMDAFDHWVKELVATGYLHNHARMWFASIWIFTLDLPWTLGADFFYRHLLDGDPASNTLSWRWVAGLQTKGKTYLARRDNIARYTNGRFQPHGLAKVAPPLPSDPHSPVQPIPAAALTCHGRDPFLLITEEDLSVEQWMPITPGHVARVQLTALRAHEAVSPPVLTFAGNALEDAMVRAKAAYGGVDGTCFDTPSPADIAAYIAQSGHDTVVTAYAPVGPVADWLARLEPELTAFGAKLVQLRRSYDDVVWPKAKKGFFALKTHIPKLLNQLLDRRS